MNENDRDIKFNETNDQKCYEFCNKWKNQLNKVQIIEESLIRESINEADQHLKIAEKHNVH